MRTWFTQKRRAYIYRVLAAVGILALSYGVVDGNELAAWLGAAAVALNVMPIANTPVSTEV